MRAAVLGLALILGACGTPPAAPSPPPPPPPEPTASVSFDSVTVADAGRALATALDLPLVVDPRAEVFAACARISLAMPSPRPRTEVVALVAEALGPSGFTLVTEATGLVLSHQGYPRPAGCPRDRDRVGTVPDVVDLLGAVGDGDGDDAAPDPALATSVRQVSDTEWEITRAYRDDAEPNALARSARIIPAVDGDVVRGVRLFGVRPGSLLATIGFQNGDTILDVNDRSFARPEEMLETFTLLRDADRYEIHLERAGEARTHVVSVVERLGR